MIKKTGQEEQIRKWLSSEKHKQQAFEMMVKLYSQQLYWKIRHFVLDHEDANDVLQNTFLKAWNNIDSFQGNSKVITWLYSIAINESLDFLRRNKNVFATDGVDDLNLANQLMADEYFDGDEAHALLLEAVATLPDVQRTVFTLHYFDNMKYSEIAEILHTTEGSLKASHHIAVRKIMEYLHRHHI